MHSDDFTFRLSKRARNVIIGKCLLVLILSAAAGWGMIVDDRKNAQRAAALTLQQYTSEFDQYKANLTKNEMSPPFNVLGALIGVGGIAIVYEALGFGIGWLVGRMAEVGHDGGLAPPNSSAA